ncbi:MAG: putative immunity protein [Candidatus Paceibacterota bacterium]
MKTQFTHLELLANKGCYSKERALQFCQDRPEIVTIKEILESEISIKDKRWFVYNACELSLNEKKKLALKLAWIVLPIYETKYPNDFRVKECLQATEDFYGGKISIEKLKVKRNAAATAAAYADAAYAYADAAYAYAAADAAAYAYADAYADAAAAYADADAFQLSYSQRIQQALIDFLYN